MRPGLYLAPPHPPTPDLQLPVQVTESGVPLGSPGRSGHWPLAALAHADPFPFPRGQAGGHRAARLLSAPLSCPFTFYSVFIECHRRVTPGERSRGPGSGQARPGPVLRESVFWSEIQSTSKRMCD